MDADLEKRLAEIEKRLSRLEDAFYGKKSGAASRGLEQRIVEKIDEIGTQDLIVIALSQKPKQTKAQIMQVLSDWGKAYGSWFEGGNFSGRLVRKGLVKNDGEDAFSLTRKGEMRADELVKALAQSSTGRT